MKFWILTLDIGEPNVHLEGFVNQIKVFDRCLHLLGVHYLSCLPW